MAAIRDMEVRAQTAPRHIVLPEGADPRIIEAGIKAASVGIAKITLLGPKDQIAQQVEDHSGITCIDPENHGDLDKYAALFADLSKKTKGDAQRLAREPLNFANLMVRAGDADGSVSGAAHATSSVVRSALRIIGVADGTSLVSSFFIMILPKPGGNVIYADCGLVIDPNATELATIAAASAKSGQMLLGLDPRIAMLSFSTKGSAAHPSADKVIEATKLVRDRHPELQIDGELQFDAAIIPEIAGRKAPESSVAGRANVFVFPDLNSGNIAYKITERLAGATAIGPILQGLAKPANDLSRGCSAEDVYNMIAVTVLQAQAAGP